MTYDGAGRLYSIPDIVNSIQYDAAGRPTTLANANGTTTNRTYSPERGFLTSITTAGLGTIQDLVYTPDAAGLVTNVTSHVGDETWGYTYDDLHRLTAATGTQGQTFQYDEIGRMTLNSRIGTYAYGGVTGAPAPGPTSVAGGTMNYDLTGNLYSGRNRTITWNAANLPSQITNQTGNTLFTYAGFGERLKKVAGTSTSIYPLGDDYEITNGVVTKYISVDGLGVLAKRVGSAPNISTYWLHTDRLGSIQAVTDMSGEVQHRTYRPYGEKIADTTSHTESRGWIDQRTDDETGLTYLHARYYEPALGLFLSPDPLHPAEPGVGLNRFAYVFDSPVNGTDHSGLDCPPTPESPCSPIWDPTKDKWVFPPSNTTTTGPGSVPWIAPGLFGGFEDNFLDHNVGHINRQRENGDERRAAKSGSGDASNPFAAGGLISNIPGRIKHLLQKLVERGVTISGEGYGPEFVGPSGKVYISPDGFTICVGVGVGVGGEEEIMSGGEIDNGLFVSPKFAVDTHSPAEFGFEATSTFRVRTGRATTEASVSLGPLKGTYSPEIGSYSFGLTDSRGAEINPRFGLSAVVRISGGVCLGSRF